MNNLTTLSLEDDFFLMDSEPMQARFTRARIKMPSEKRWGREYGTKKNYQQPKYEVKTSEELKNAVSQIYDGNMNQDLYQTSNGLYRERMRVAQAVRDRYAHRRQIPIDVKTILSANYGELHTLRNPLAQTKPWRMKMTPWKTRSEKT